MNGHCACCFPLLCISFWPSIIKWRLKLKEATCSAQGHTTNGGSGPLSKQEGFTCWLIALPSGNHSGSLICGMSGVSANTESLLLAPGEAECWGTRDGTCVVVPPWRSPWAWKWEDLWPWCHLFLPPADTGQEGLCLSQHHTGSLLTKETAASTCFSRI